MPIDIAREMARQGEVRLGALMDLATAADIRATTICGISGAAAIAVGGAVLAGFASETPVTQLLIPGAITAVGLFVAAIIAAFAGAPRDFYIAGGNPDSLRDWAWEGTKWRDEARMLESTALRYAESIKQNRQILEAGSFKVNASLWTAFGSSVCGLAAYFVILLT